MHKNKYIKRDKSAYGQESAVEVEIAFWSYEFNGQKSSEICDLEGVEKNRFHEVLQFIFCRSIPLKVGEFIVWEVFKL